MPVGGGYHLLLHPLSVARDAYPKHTSQYNIKYLLITTTLKNAWIARESHLWYKSLLAINASILKFHFSISTFIWPSVNDTIYSLKILWRFI